MDETTIKEKGGSAEDRTEEELSHRHGGLPEKDFDRFSLPVAPVVDFSVNLNPLGFPEEVRRQWPSLIQGIEAYPSLEGRGVTAYFQERLDLPPENILAGNGSTELIYLAPRALGFRRAAVMTPSYHDYYRASVLAGAEIMRVALSFEEDFRPPGKSVLDQALRGVDALWLGNPNNPTGILLTRGFVEDLALRHPDKWILVDEAFMPFVESWRRESMALRPLFPNVIVIHSLTKFYGLAGLRLGAATAHRDVIERLRRAKEPWTVNGVADRIAPLLLGAESYEEETRRLVSGERERMFEALSEIKGIRPFPSRANFLLCRYETGPGLDRLLRRLLAEGLYVRDCRNFPGLERDFFRAAVKTPAENDRLIRSLADQARGLNA
jgi:threonine-phosphate decarboxylase